MTKQLKQQITNQGVAQYAGLETYCTLTTSSGDEYHVEVVMKDKFGIGLASPQLGMGYRMFVMTLSTGEDIGVYNPEILEFSEETVGMEEGCLTFPLLYFIVTRPAKVKVRFQTHDQQVVEDWLDGMDARCFQHEFDHLQGKLYLEYASDLKLKRAIKKRDKQFKILQTDLALQKIQDGT